MKAAPRLRFQGRNPGGASVAPKVTANSHSRPVQDVSPLLDLTIKSLLPASYSFEVPKTLALIKKLNAKRVGLQLPEGLLMFACTLSDILASFGGVDCVVLGDVTYGACCIDDYTAIELGVDLLVHYGHSCLVPMDQVGIPTMYVFVEIDVNETHLLNTIKKNFPKALERGISDKKEARVDIQIDEGLVNDEREDQRPLRLAVVSTVQFLNAVQLLADAFPSPKPRRDGKITPVIVPSIEETKDSLALTIPKTARKLEVVIPQIRPLSPGEILGCTSPDLTPHNVDGILYIGDGRFHLESIMLANPTLPAFRCDPYSKVLTREFYDHPALRSIRKDAMIEAKASLSHANGTEAQWGVVLGTLGRQGNRRMMESITSHLESYPSTTVVPLLMSELSPTKATLLPSISTLIQTSCPRLSIDWGYAFPKPLLSPFEAGMVLGKVEGREIDGSQSMDFYADDGWGEWTPRFGMGRKRVKALSGH